jgi:integrase/recombinase XerD
MKAAENCRVCSEFRHRWIEAVVEWKEEAPRTLRPGTLKRYLVSLAQQRGILDDLYIDEISTDTVNQIAFREGVSNATRRRDLTVVAAVLRWCVAKQWRKDNPAEAWHRAIIKEKRDPMILPSDYDIDAVVAVATGNFAQMIRCAQYTGMREEECASLEWPDISLMRNIAQLQRTKTNRRRLVPLSQRAIGVLRATPASLNTKFIFWHEPPIRYHVRHDTNDPSKYRYANVASNFRAIVKRAQRNAKRESRAEPRAFRFHDLLHWFAIDYLRRGGSIYTLRRILGHASIKTTEIYLSYLTPAEQLRAKRFDMKPGTGPTTCRQNDASFLDVERHGT